MSLQVGLVLRAIASFHAQFFGGPLKAQPGAAAETLSLLDHFPPWDNKRIRSLVRRGSTNGYKEFCILLSGRAEKWERLRNRAVERGWDAEELDLACDRSGQFASFMKLFRVRIGSVFQAMKQMPQTLIHGDLHAENVHVNVKGFRDLLGMAAEDGSGRWRKDSDHLFRFAEFQLFAWGPAARDVANFVLYSCAVADRRAHMEGWCKLYCDALGKALGER